MLGFERLLGKSVAADFAPVAVESLGGAPRADADDGAEDLEAEHEPAPERRPRRRLTRAAVTPELIKALALLIKARRMQPARGEQQALFGRPAPAPTPAPSPPAPAPTVAEPPAPAPAPAGPTEYRYGAYNRPPGFGATPKGILRVDPPIPGVLETRHGVVVYPRQLTDDEVQSYELSPHVPVHEAVQRMADGLGEYADAYLDDADEDADDSRLREALHEGLHAGMTRGRRHSDLPADEIATRAIAELRQRRAARPAPAPAVPVKPQEYRYGAGYRPPGLAAVPDGYTRVDPPLPGVEQTRHGVVVYPRPLTDHEIHQFQLSPHVPKAELVGRMLDSVGDKGAAFVAMAQRAGDGVIRSRMGKVLQAGNLHSDVPDSDVLAEAVAELKRRHGTAEKAPEAPTATASHQAAVEPRRTSDEVHVKQHLRQTTHGVQVVKEHVAHVKTAAEHPAPPPEPPALPTLIGSEKQIAYATTRRGQFLAAIAVAPAAIQAMVAEAVADGQTMEELQPGLAVLHRWLADVETILTSRSAAAILDITGRVKIDRTGGIAGWMLSQIENNRISRDEAMFTARALKQAQELGKAGPPPAPGLELLPAEDNPRVRRWQRVQPHEVHPGATFQVREPEHGDHILHIRHANDHEVGLSWGETRSVWRSPPASVPQLVSDLRGEVHGSPTSGDPTVDAVLDGKGEWLGKGNDGIVHRVGHEVVKSSTVAGDHPENGIRSIEESNQITRNEHDAHRAMAHHPLVPAVRLVEHEGRAHLVKPYLHPAGRLSRAEVEAAQDFMESAHHHGLVALDQWQFGRDDHGAIKIMDLGSARRSTSHDHREDDQMYMDRLWRDNGHEGRNPKGVELERKLAGARLLLNMPLHGAEKTGKVTEWLSSAWSKYRRLFDLKSVELLAQDRDDEWNALHDERDAYQRRIDAVHAAAAGTATSAG